MASCDTEESTETTAFLSNEENVRSGASERAEEKSYLRYVLAINALTVFAMYHLLAPRTRLLELAICYSYYEVNDNSRIVSQNHWPWYDISEQECKLSPIQEKLAFLRSWGSLLEPLPGMIGNSSPRLYSSYPISALITSIFYGALAEKYGRRLTYVLGVIGLILSYMWYLLVCARERVSFHVHPVTVSRHVSIDDIGQRYLGKLRIFADRRSARVVNCYHDHYGHRCHV